MYAQSEQLELSPGNQTPFSFIHILYRIYSEGRNEVP